MPSLWYKSRNIEWDVGPYPAANAQAYFFLGGVEGTAITVYADAAESSPLPNPVIADGNGRWPAVYVPYMDSFGVRVLNEANVQLWLDDLIPNPNPVEVNVDPPATGGVETGMFHWEPIQGVKAGYVRANGKSIGNAASSATERANADTEDLFLYLWNALADGQAAVLPGGRGASAVADFAANKRISLPDFRGGGPVGLDDMGGIAGSYFAGLTFPNGNSTTPGSSLGNNAHTLTVAELPSHGHTATTDTIAAHDHGGATGTQSVNHTHSSTSITVSTATAHTHTGTTNTETTDHTHGVNGGTQPSGSHSHTVPISGGPGGVTLAQSAATNAANVSTSSTVGDHSHTISFTSGGRSLAHQHTFTSDTGGSHNHTLSGNTGNESVNHTHAISAAGSHSHTVTVNNSGSGAAHANLGRSILGTWYVKL